MRATPEAWLAARGFASQRLRRIETATTAELLVVDGHVLRWYAGGSFLDEEPDALAREVAALTTLVDGPVPAPRLIAWSDEPPALLMTLRPGEHRLDPADPGAVVAVLDAIHAVDRAPFGRWTYRGYHEGRDLPPPSWWRTTETWETAVRHSSMALPSFAPVVIHRDFHPGNLLWSDADISGVLDWGNVCLGPAPFDLAHHRVNLATLVGQNATDRAHAGDPRWDIEAALGYIDPWSREAREGWIGPWPHVPTTIARERVEAFIAHAVAALG